MDHKCFIQSLKEDLEPVKPVSCERIRSLIFLLLAYIAVFSGAAIIGFRADLDMILTNPSLLFQLLVLLAAGIFSVLASFRLSIPSERVGLTNWVLIVLSTIMLASVMIYCAVAGDITKTQGFLTLSMVTERIRNALLLSIIPAVMMVFMIKRASPVHVSLVGFTSFMAVTCLAVVGCRLTCPIDDLYANLLWHYTPIIVLSLIGYFIGRLLYRW